ncbi:MAG TPA: hypothetical protein VF541_20410 [Longimicrobium sp.]|jgi:hypothetical protein
MANTRSRIARLVTVAIASLAAACTDAATGDKLPTDAGAGLYPQIVVGIGKGTAQADLSLRQVPGGLSLGSYQGEVVFNPAVLTLQSAEFPEGVIGAANEVAPGRIRFAGSALDGTDGALVLRMRFAVKSTVTRSVFSATFEEVTDAVEFADVTAQVKNGTLLYQQR